MRTNETGAGASRVTRVRVSSSNNVFNVINSTSYGTETERKRNQIYGLSTKIARIQETRQGSR